MDWEVRVGFQTDLGKLFEKARDCLGEDVE